jgi:hypothetical protein
MENADAIVEKLFATKQSVASVVIKTELDHDII